MQAERRITFSFFVVCVVAAMPFAWGAGGFPNPHLVKSGSSAVTLCHIPPGNPPNAVTIVVAPAAVAAHLAHGDFLGECHPVCAGVPSAVPKTGQTGCWNGTGVPVNCAGTGQDGELRKGVSVSPRFTDNGDGTVNDNLTGLIWLKDSSCLGYFDWTSALVAAATLASGSCDLTDGSAAGDWRMPNVKELQSLIDYGQIEPSLPVGHPFSGVQLFHYWTSTSHAGLENYAWFVNLSFSYLSYDGKFENYYVWPVRGRK